MEEKLSHDNALYLLYSQEKYKKCIKHRVSGNVVTSAEFKGEDAYIIAKSFLRLKQYCKAIEWFHYAKMDEFDEDRNYVRDQSNSNGIATNLQLQCKIARIDSSPHNFQAQQAVLRQLSLLIDPFDASDAHDLKITQQARFVELLLNVWSNDNSELKMDMILFALQTMEIPLSVLNAALKNKLKSNSCSMIDVTKIEAEKSKIVHKVRDYLQLLSVLCELQNNIDCNHKRINIGDNQDINSDDSEWKKYLLNELFVPKAQPYPELPSPPTVTKKEMTLDSRWQNDSETLRQLSGSEIDLREYQKYKKLIDVQNKRLETEIGSKLSEMKEMVFKLDDTIAHDKKMIQQLKEQFASVQKCAQSLELAYHEKESELMQCYSDCCSLRQEQSKKIAKMMECTQLLISHQKDSAVHRGDQDGLKDLLQKYERFICSNQKVIECVMHRYDVQWQKFEHKWRKWSPSEIILYLKYKLNFTGIDFDGMENKMNQEKFKGKYLVSLDTSELELYGVTNDDFQTEILDIICALCVKCKHADRSVLRALLVENN